MATPDQPPPSLGRQTPEEVDASGERAQACWCAADHIATLLRSKKAIPKLKDFVYGPRSDFYLFAQQRYAQGWALVHFLRKSTPARFALGHLLARLASVVDSPWAMALVETLQRVGITPVRPA